MSAYQSIQQRLHFDHELPYTENWSAAADFLDLIIDHCLENKPSHILECSSGLTTLVLAKCCQVNNHGTMQSLENGAEYVKSTEQQLASFGLTAYCKLIHAPLETKIINGHDFQWYNTSNLADSNIDMLVIDGPPGFIQKHSRYPALPLLYRQLSNNSVIFLDDAARDDEKALVKMWLNEYPDSRHEYLDTERGCSVLTIYKNIS